MMVAGLSASDPVSDSGPPNHFLGYGKAPPRVDASAVLVRLTFHENTPGVSTASISYNPGPHLNPGSNAIAFDGRIFPASIAFGRDSPGTPVVTDSPQPTATPSPMPPTWVTPTGTV